MEKKFVEVVENSRYEVLTDVGFVPVKKSMKTIDYDVYKLRLSNGLTLECADTHILMTSDMTEVFARDSMGVIIKTRHGPATVVCLDKTERSEGMYDLELERHHMFYTNDILSHNTTVVAAFLLHLALFTPDYGIAVLANKKDQAAETLQRIKLMYECLPWFLQVGVKRWNVNDIVLDIGKKGTTIFTAATKGSGIRGKSVNCLGPDVDVEIVHNETGEVFLMSISELFEMLENYDIT